MSPEANLLRLAYIDINALLVEGFDINAQDLVDSFRFSQDNYEIVERSSGYWIVNNSGVIDDKVALRYRLEAPYINVEDAKEALERLKPVTLHKDSTLYAVANTLTEIRDFFKADSRKKEVEV
jgi:hypothetical protein